MIEREVAERESIETAALEEKQELNVTDEPASEAEAGGLDPIILAAIGGSIVVIILIIIIIIIIAKKKKDKPE